MRLRARQLLFRQLQQFFEQHLAEYWRISDVEFDDPVMEDKVPGVRQRPQEIVIGRFDDYTIRLASTVEHPPLGDIICAGPDGSVSGHIDEITWKRIATMIKATQGKRIQHHVYG